MQCGLKIEPRPVTALTLSLLVTLSNALQIENVQHVEEELIGGLNWMMYTCL